MRNTKDRPKGNIFVLHWSFSRYPFTSSLIEAGQRHTNENRWTYVNFTLKEYEVHKRFTVHSEMSEQYTNQY